MIMPSLRKIGCTVLLGSDLYSNVSLRKKTYLSTCKICAMGHDFLLEFGWYISINVRVAEPTRK